MSRRKPDSSPSLITHLEEATHLLRETPASAWVLYYATSLPFVLYLFFYINDMARSANASEGLLSGSLVLSLLYGVMKTGQAFYCDRLMGMLQGSSGSRRLSVAAWSRLLGSQLCVHATAPWVLLISLVAMVPLPWTYAFYHNVTILAVDHFRRGGKTLGLLRAAAAQAHLGWMQSALFMAVLKATALLAYLNVFAAFALGASLLKSFSGVENPFTMNGMLYMSSTVQGFIILVCYLALNPFVKGAYILRCFYGESRRTGADLEWNLRWIISHKSAAVLVAVSLLGGGISSGFAQAPSPEAAPAFGKKEESLSRNIRQVMAKSEYQWRLPREGGGTAEAEANSDSLFDELGRWLKSMFETIGNGIGDFIDWFSGRETTAAPVPMSGGSTTWMAALPKLLVILGVALLGALGWLLYRNWKQSRQVAVAEGGDIPPEIDLESEQVVASQLPENEWLRMAREKRDSGELRLALRAMFLASLAHLGEKRVLQITRTKSNGDYVRELARKARGQEALHHSFLNQVHTFDRVWYGWHDVTEELVARFQTEHEQITHHAS
jgi:hypothetical protein